MKTKNYLEQARNWPTAGRHILAQFDETSICVYQAYRPSIAEFAVAYANQVELDYECFTKAVREGKIEARLDDDV